MSEDRRPMYVKTNDLVGWSYIYLEEANGFPIVYRLAARASDSVYLGVMVFSEDKESFFKTARESVFFRVRTQYEESDYNTLTINPEMLRQTPTEAMKLVMNIAASHPDWDKELLQRE